MEENVMGIIQDPNIHDKNNKIFSNILNCFHKDSHLVLHFITESRWINLGRSWKDCSHILRTHQINYIKEAKLEGNRRALCFWFCLKNNQEHHQGQSHSLG